jgi:UDP-N-acetyl-D-glucosamine dehydrogenase
LAYHDPYVECVAVLGGEESVELTSDVVEGADAVLVVTDHERVDFDLGAESATLVLDTRNVAGLGGKHVWRL